MSNVCEKCANELVGESIKCGGFCSAHFCMKCSGMTTELQNTFSKNHHLVWMCYACHNLLAKARFTNAVTSVNAANEGILDALKTEIKGSILNDIRAEIRTNFKSLIDAVPSTTLTFRPPPKFTPVNKRPRDAEADDDNTIKQPAKLLCGTGAHNPEVSTAALQPTSDHPPSFWLYLSNIQPDVADDKVRDMVHQCLETSELKLVKLIPKNRDPRTLTFVSYKVGVPADLKEKAMSSNTWPIGVRFREFEDHGRQRQVFWSPTSPAPETQPMTE